MPFSRSRAPWRGPAGSRRANGAPPWRQTLASETRPGDSMLDVEQALEPALGGRRRVLGGAHLEMPRGVLERLGPVGQVGYVREAHVLEQVPQDLEVVAELVHVVLVLLPA